MLWDKMYWKSERRSEAIVIFPLRCFAEHDVIRFMAYISKAENLFHIGFDGIVLIVAVAFFVAVFVFEAMPLENNKWIAAQLVLSALLSQICVLFGDIYPDIPALSVFVDMTIYWYAYNISFSDTEFARLLTPISDFLSKPMIERYRWILRLSIFLTTMAYIARIVGCFQQSAFLDWLAAVKVI